MQYSDSYKSLTNRNIGILTEFQQETLRQACVAVFGLGGLGGVVAELLARSGVGRLRITDFDTFEPTNLNRQVFAYTDTLGQNKTDVTEQFLKKINPELEIVKYSQPAQENIGQILQGTGAAVLAIDNILPCLVTSRACRQARIPLIEGWAIPFANARVFTDQTPSLEDVYQLPTKDRDIALLSEEEIRGLNLHMLAQLKKIRGVQEYYPPAAIDRIMKGQTPSFAPLVWMTAVLMSIECVKSLLGLPTLALAPRFCVYDPFQHCIPEQEGP